MGEREGDWSVWGGVLWKQRKAGERGGGLGKNGPAERAGGEPLWGEKAGQMEESI